MGCLGGVKYYLAETNHPLVQIFYLVIAVGGYEYLDVDLLDMRTMEYLNTCQTM